jgi:hypothetical protein
VEEETEEEHEGRKCCNARRRRIEDLGAKANRKGIEAAR